MSSKLYTTLERNAENETHPQLQVVTSVLAQIHMHRSQLGRCLLGTSECSLRCPSAAQTHCTRKPRRGSPQSLWLRKSFFLLWDFSPGQKQRDCGWNASYTRPAFYGSLKTLDVKTTHIYMRVCGEWDSKDVSLAHGWSAYFPLVFCTLTFFRVLENVMFLQLFTLKA